MRDSIFKSSLRLFFSVLSAVVGACAGLFLIIAAMGSISTTAEADPEIEYRYEPKIAPNAKNIRKSLPNSSPVILKININGEIGTETLNKSTIENLLIESRERNFKDDRVKGIILNINTPGGTVIDANAIYRALKMYKSAYKTPIYAYVDGLCASGGMYIACAADKIYSSDVSIIGSVGVLLGPFMNVYKLMEKVGVSSETMTAGKGKDQMNPFKEWGPDEGRDLRGITEHFYNHFVKIVTTNRPKVDEKKLKDEYGAQVFNAATALEYGFVDGADQSFNETLSLLAKEIGIDEDAYQVIELENNSWLATLFKGKLDLGLLQGKMKHTLDLPLFLNPEYMNQPLYLYRPE